MATYGITKRTKLTKKQLAAIKPGSFDQRMVNFEGYAEVRDFFKRCRNPQSFVMDKSTLDKLKPYCSVCHQRITGEEWNGLQEWEGGNNHGHRGKWFPKTKTMVHAHYTCAWKRVLADVCSRRLP